MTLDDSIFSCRFKSNETLQPNPEELRAFWERAIERRNANLHISDLTRYRQLLNNASSFAEHDQADSKRQDFREHLFYGVHSHARFANEALLAAVELYQYHLHGLELLDFRNPITFMKSAEKEMGRLNKKKIDDVVRIMRLQEMIREREKIIMRLKKQWTVLAAELHRIALYVSDNLMRVERLCDKAVVHLAELGIGKHREQQLLADIKTRFKERIKSAMSRGLVTRQDLENTKREFDAVSLEMIVLIREDIDVLTESYEDLRDHIRKTVNDITNLLSPVERKKSETILESTGRYERIGHLLSSLLTDYPSEPRPSLIHESAAYDDIIQRKREEMVYSLLEQIRQERRCATVDRRSLKERRKSMETSYGGPERRSGEDRRSGKSRRKSGNVP